MLAPLCSDDDVELKKDAKLFDDMGLVLLSSEPSDCLKCMFQIFQRHYIKGRRHVKSRMHLIFKRILDNQKQA